MFEIIYVDDTNDDYPVGGERKKKIAITARAQLVYFIWE
jgi:hypothetical protein